MSWLKLHDELVSDPKLRRLPVPHRYAFVVLLCLANRSKVKGSIFLNDDDLAFELELSIEDWQNLKTTLQSKRVLEIVPNGIRLINWENRQEEVIQGEIVAEVKAKPIDTLALQFSGAFREYSDFRKQYQGIIAIGGGGWGVDREAKLAWEKLFNEGAINDEFWRGVQLYRGQVMHKIAIGQKVFVPGAAKFLEGRYWEIANTEDAIVVAANTHGIDLSPKSKRLAESKQRSSEFRKATAEARQRLIERGVIPA